MKNKLSILLTVIVAVAATAVGVYMGNRQTEAPPAATAATSGPGPSRP